MNQLQYLLVKLAEECTEGALIALKTAQLGPHETRPGQSLTNFERVPQELDDLSASIERLNSQHVFDYLPKREKLESKAQVRKYLDYSRSLRLVAGWPASTPIAMGLATRVRPLKPLMVGQSCPNSLTSPACTAKRGCMVPGAWGLPRRGHSPMTPWRAQGFGYVRAIAGTLADPGPFEATNASAN